MDYYPYSWSLLVGYGSYLAHLVVVSIAYIGHIHGLHNCDGDVSLLVVSVVYLCIVFIFIHECIYTSILEYTQVCPPTHQPTYVHIYIHKHMRIYIHIFIYPHHIQTYPPTHPLHPYRCTSSRIRTYFRLFLQEQRPYALGSAVPAPSTPTPIGTGGGGGNTGIATGGSSSGVASGVVAATTGVNSGGGGGGIETLKAFLTSGGTGVGSGGSGGGGGGGGGGAAGAGAGGVSGLGGADLRLGRFLLSSKRYRSTRSRSTSFIWSNNGVWKVNILLLINYVESKSIPGVPRFPEPRSPHDMQLHVYLVVGTTFFSSFQKQEIMPFGEASE